MNVTDLRNEGEKDDYKKIIFGVDGDYIKNQNNGCILIAEEDSDLEFKLYKKDIDLLIKALQLAKEWK